MISLDSNTSREALLILDGWIEHTGVASPQDRFSNPWWRSAFHRIGLHHVDVWMETADVRDLFTGEIATVQTSNLTTVNRVDSLEPPKYLYRASVPGEEGRWDWYEDFAMAKLIIDDSGQGLRMWACEPGEVFAKVTVDRTEPGGYRGQWTQWVVEPKNVHEISRLRDPYANIEDLESWERQGTHAIELAGLVGSWFRSTGTKLAPMDKEGGDYWLSQFNNLGQFDAFYSWDDADQSVQKEMEIKPAVDLVAPKVLYRGAPDHLKGRWSWTPELETAEVFRKLFCPDDGKIWVAEAATVFGVIRAEIKNPRLPFTGDFTEWIIMPKDHTIREYVPGPLDDD